MAKDGRAEAGSLGPWLSGEGGPLLDFHDWINLRKWMWRQSSNILKDQWKFIDYRLYSYMIYIYINLFKEPRWTLKFRRPSTFLLRASRDQLPGFQNGTPHLYEMSLFRPKFQHLGSYSTPLSGDSPFVDDCTTRCRRWSERLVINSDLNQWEELGFLKFITPFLPAL